MPLLDARLEAALDELAAQPCGELVELARLVGRRAAALQEPRPARADDVGLRAAPDEQEQPALDTGPRVQLGVDRLHAAGAHDGDVDAERRETLDAAAHRRRVDLEAGHGGAQPLEDDHGVETAELVETAGRATGGGEGRPRLGRPAVHSVTCRAPWRSSGARFPSVRRPGTLALPRAQRKAGRGSAPRTAVARPASVAVRRATPARTVDLTRGRRPAGRQLWPATAT